MLYNPERKYCFVETAAVLPMLNTLRPSSLADMKSRGVRFQRLH
jgi:hypothetical protein